VAAVRPFNLLGLRYLRVFAKGSASAVWVPLYLTDRPRFEERVRQHAGADHPLTRALPT
jgi:hypothetical protein